MRPFLCCEAHRGFRQSWIRGTCRFTMLDKHITTHKKDEYSFTECISEGGGGEEEERGRGGRGRERGGRGMRRSYFYSAFSQSLQSGNIFCPVKAGGSPLWLWLCCGDSCHSHSSVWTTLGIQENKPTIKGRQIYRSTKLMLKFR